MTLKQFMRRFKYDPASETLVDVSGNGEALTVAAGTLTASVVTGHGARGAVGQVAGDTSTRLVLGSELIGGTFTICSTTRYVTGGVHQHVLKAGRRRWFFHGHGSGKAGIARYHHAAQPTPF